MFCKNYLQLVVEIEGNRAKNPYATRKFQSKIK